MRPRATDGPLWPDVVAPVEVRSDGHLDAAMLVSVEDYQELPDRPGAHAIAGAWYRYLRERRGVRPYRMFWLRDGQATPRAIRDALLRAHWAAGKDATLWLVVVGHIGSGPEHQRGLLLHARSSGAPDPGLDTTLPQMLRIAGHGYHNKTVAIFDGCLPTASDALGSGAPASALPSLRGTTDMPATSVTIEPFGYGGGVPITHNLVLRREPTDLVVFTSGVAPHCVEQLPGTATPALSYLLLGSVRGWADRDADGRVTASEALRTVEELLRGAGSRPQARGADIVLARDAREARPAVPEVTPRPGEVARVPAPPPAEFVDDQMIKIPRGRFSLGCRARRDPDCEPDEFPRRQIFLDSFAIDRYEVTWKQYAECVAAGACSALALARCEVWTDEGFVRGASIPERFRGASQPVVCATWAQAAEFCEWHGKRLPTEAEWERAARGDGITQYPWGDDPPTCARAQNYQCGYTTAPVGTHPAGASPEGVHDLAGNVSEWVHDWYTKKAYRDSARQNPAGPSRGEVRVVRGGSFYDGHGDLRISYRYGLSPEFGFGTVGFRCAR